MRSFRVDTPSGILTSIGSVSTSGSGPTPRCGDYPALILRSITVELTRQLIGILPNL